MGLSFRFSILCNFFVVAYFISYKKIGCGGFRYELWGDVFDKFLFISLIAQV